MRLFYFLVLIASASSHFLYDDNEKTINHISKAMQTKCQDSKDCRINNTQCLEGICTCYSGFVFDGTFARCLKVATSYNHECQESVQCSSFLSVGGACVDGKCICLEGYHYLKGRCYETRGLYESCLTDEQCFVKANYQAASCIGGICKCSKGYYQREISTCRPLRNLGDSCMLDSDCISNGENVACQSSICVSVDKDQVRDSNVNFKHNYENEIPNGNNSNSGENKISETIEIGSNCESHNDCESINNAICSVDKTCICDRSYSPSDDNSKCLPEIGNYCDDKSVGQHVEYSECLQNTWTCEIDRTTIGSNNLCRKLTKDINKKCTYPELCQLFGPRAKCVNEKCICDETSHWVEKEKFCWLSKIINESCEKDRDCRSQENSPKPVCSGEDGEKKCSCPKDAHPGKDNRYCVSDVPKLNIYCEQNKDCKVEESSCNSNKCTCNLNHFEQEGACVAGLNAPCVKDDDCKMDNTVCFSKSKQNETKVCSCKPEFTIGPDNQCVPKSAYREDCEYDIQCTTVTANSKCYIKEISRAEIEEGSEEESGKYSGHCECIEGYYYKYGACFEKKRLGDECMRMGECYTKNSIAVCKNGKCSCDFGYEQHKLECKKLNEVNNAVTRQSSYLILSVCTFLTLAARRS